MTALKQKHYSHLRVVKSGNENHPKQKFSKKSRYYFKKRNKKRKACLEQKSLFFANACVVPERGKAIQYGIFNQGGEMDIFEKEKIA